MAKKPHIIFTDDEDTFRNIMTKELSRMGYNVVSCSSGAETIKNIAECDFDIVMLDINMPVMDGIEILKKVKELDPTTEVVILTGQGTIENAVQAIKLGAYDYITKPCRLVELDVLLQKALKKRQLNRENVHLKRLVKDVQRTSVMTGNSIAMHTVYKMIDKVSPSDSIVLIQGESGTGKEIIARTLHLRSPRSDKPFVVVNCATLQETLLESELFGHMKGAFTGATESRMGLFEAADGGTLFLDEIGELTIGTQAKLLRAVQSGEVRRIGTNRVITVDTRIIAATHKNLAVEVKNGRFREDLFFRLNVITLSLPPLRERKEDIPFFIDHFLRDFCQNMPQKKMLPEAIAAMTHYTWPGNVRELENTIERLVVMTEDENISVEDLPENIRGIPSFPNLTQCAEGTLSEVEKKYILKVLHEKQWNKTLAAEALGISLKTLYNKLKVYHIDQE
ncbi:Transcriptional regulatory protein ZraR [Candidatus Brocadiaceae bacterium B188]|nr:sigma-54-dependent Fis family transcriptional regulator [Candidatus Brocadia sapporoensis]QQR65817.1 MAG: sigma-54-dependent Fis family transcriptional regulator [Candidatus Brocadia sp.]RZV59684.1 MAG: sigma-54-dependent Fis family transcriptional regulator [Candidatus Brocadia sp. BROELEC01]TWU50147.1 Transcriptional regulatory protein ZraR [Candidatus Brocadiaceae bacterium B188]